MGTKRILEITILKFFVYVSHFLYNNTDFFNWMPIIKSFCFHIKPVIFSFISILPSKVNFVTKCSVEHLMCSYRNPIFLTWRYSMYLNNDNKNGIYVYFSTTLQTTCNVHFKQSNGTRQLALFNDEE